MPTAKRKVNVLPRRRLLLQQGLALLGLGALTVRSSWGDTTSPATTAEATRLTFVRAWVFLLYPHASLNPAIFDDIARGIVSKAAADPASRALLEGGIGSLNAAANGDWLSLSPAQRTVVLEQQQASPAFAFVRSTAAYSLYTRPDVWESLGYGGDAWSFGGYSREQVNSIDWLPEPKPAS